MAVFDFEIGVATSELLDVAVGVGLCGEKGLFKQIEVGLHFGFENENQEVA